MPLSVICGCYSVVGAVILMSQVTENLVDIITVCSQISDTWLLHYTLQTACGQIWICKWKSVSWVLVCWCDVLSHPFMTLDYYFFINISLIYDYYYICIYCCLSVSTLTVLALVTNSSMWYFFSDFYSHFF